MKEKIYFIPGLMCDERLWERVFPYLEEHFELVALKIPLSNSFDVIIKIIEQEFQEEKVNLFGFSFGAYIAAYYAVKKPSKIKRLFLNAGTPSVMTPSEIEKRNNMLEMMHNFGFRGLSSQKVASLLEEPNQNDSDLIRLIQDMYVDLGKETYISQMKTINNRIALEKELINLTHIPIKMFYSTNDRLLNYDSLNTFTTHHTHVTKISRKGTSHMIPLENPKLLSDEILSWMGT